MGDDHPRPDLSSIQAFEYSEAPFPFKGLNYGAAFFMSTGFHGFHVMIGTVFLIVCQIRVYQGHFTPQQHFGFEAAAWYWHFVDVVWLFLFVTIYVYGGWGAPVTPGDPVSDGPAVATAPTPVAAALQGLCPRCGAPGLFRGWLDFADRCNVCGLDYSAFNVGDGPARS